MWILITVIATYSGATSFTTTFETKEACFAAANAVAKQVGTVTQTDRIVSNVCAKK